jgi:uncharacterized protein YggE
LHGGLGECEGGVMTKRVFLSFVLLVVTTWSAWGQYGYGYSTNRTITVSGSAQVKVAPDEVDLQLGIETVNPDLAKAKQENDQKIEAVLKSLKAQKLESRAVQTDAIVIEPHYWSRSSSSEPAPPKLTHYTVRRDVIVALKDVSKFEAVLSAALESGANHVRNITFKSSELRKHRDQARSMAIRAAKEKAVALAGELGMKVGKPFTINESAGNLYLAYGANRGNALMNTQNVASQEGPAAEVVQGTFAPGQISIDASVSVVFELQ